MTDRYRYLRPEALECLQKGTLYTECERQPTRFAYGEAILEVGAQIPEVVVLNADGSESDDEVDLGRADSLVVVQALRDEHDLALACGTPSATEAG